MRRGVKAGSLRVCLAAVCAGLAVYMTVYKLVFAFPVLPYLKFEVAEVPVVVAFFSAGPLYGLISAAIYWAVLTLVGEWTPLGPAMKFLAVAPMLLGLWAGSTIHRRLLNGKWGMRGFFALSLPTAIVLRVIVCSLTNFVVLWCLFPFFLDIASASMKATLGIDIPGREAALTWTLIFTAIFNIIHVFLSTIPSYIVAKAASKAGIAKLWINELQRGGGA
jgi:riboflavin transporter FmnP